jgi:signal transduction histidine kinase
MLHEFLTAHRATLIERCRAKVVARDAPSGTGPESAHGISRFLGQLIKTLEVERTSQPDLSRKISGVSDGNPVLSEIGTTATLHGRDLMKRGFSVEQVVHDYGDLCQTITDLAVENNEPIAVEEFRTLNRCLDNGIADAVKEFGYQQKLAYLESGGQAQNERLGFLVHELRNFIGTATLAAAAIKTGEVASNGATAAVLDRSLSGMRNLIDHTVEEVRSAAGIPRRSQVVSVDEFIAEAKVIASLEAAAGECKLSVAAVDPALGVEADREMLFSALRNLLQNAFKFTHRHSTVFLNAHASGDRVLIDVEDHCGGLPPGDPERLFQSFAQGDADKSGLGLGLSMSRRGVEANAGRLRVRDMPGSGCVFTIDLPRRALPVAQPASDRLDIEKGALSLL